MKRTTRAAVLAALLVTGCDTGDGRTLDDPTRPLPAPATVATSAPSPTPPPALTLVTPWQDGAAIPTRYTCDGDDLAPPLSWANVPPGTIELAVTLTDLDAPQFIHWVVYAIPAGATGLAEGSVPAGSFQWINSTGEAGYAGPCPPAGEVHRYQITVHALNQQLEVADDAAATEIVSILNLTAIDQASVSGTYARGG